MEHLSPWIDATAEDREAWNTYARDLTVNYALVTCTALSGAIVFWWPLDYVVGTDAAYVDAFFVLRIGMLSILGVLAVCFRFAAWGRRYSIQLGIAGYALVMGLIGYALGMIGGRICRGSQTHSSGSCRWRWCRYRFATAFPPRSPSRLRSWWDSWGFIRNIGAIRTPADR